MFPALRDSEVPARVSDYECFKGNESSYLIISISDLKEKKIPNQLDLKADWNTTWAGGVKRLLEGFIEKTVD